MGIICAYDEKCSPYKGLPKAKGQTICECCLADFSVDLRNKITNGLIQYVLSSLTE